MHDIRLPGEGSDVEEFGEDAMKELGRAGLIMGGLFLAFFFGLPEVVRICLWCSSNGF